MIEAAQVTLDHEVAGLTDDDTPVGIEALAPCGTCGPCLDGDYNLFRTSGTMLFGIGRDGGIADEMWVPARAVGRALGCEVDLAKPSPQVVIPGIYRGPVALPGLTMCLEQVSLCPTTLHGRHAGGRDVDNAAALLATTPELAPTIVTHRFPLEAAVDAFSSAASRAAGAIKVILEP